MSLFMNPSKGVDGGYCGIIDSSHGGPSWMPHALIFWLSCSLIASLFKFKKGHELGGWQGLSYGVVLYKSSMIPGVVYIIGLRSSAEARIWQSRMSWKGSKSAVFDDRACSRRPQYLLGRNRDVAGWARNERESSFFKTRALVSV